MLQTQEGLPLVTGPGEGTPTTKVHVYGDNWELQGYGYQAVKFSKQKCSSLLLRVESLT